MAAALECQGLFGGYSGMAVVHDLNLHVETGEVVALIGPNGAGKTTTLLSLAGSLPLISGQVLLGGVPTTAPLHKRAKSGLGFVTEERSIFRELSTAENLRVGGVSREDALQYFPQLATFMNRKAGLLSGGEQQMLTLARALARKPTVLLTDELSLGLAPLVVDRLLLTVREAADNGCAVIIVEQHISKALDMADRVYLLQRGHLLLEGRAEDFRGRVEDLEASYLGTTSDDPVLPLSSEKK